jgi:hypothetical protein
MPEAREIDNLLKIEGCNFTTCDTRHPWMRRDKVRHLVFEKKTGVPACVSAASSSGICGHFKV